MKTYRVAVTWTAWQDIYIEAESEDEANIKAAKLEAPKLGNPYQRSLNVDSIWDNETNNMVGPNSKFNDAYLGFIANQQQNFDWR